MIGDIFICLKWLNNYKVVLNILECSIEKECYKVRKGRGRWVWCNLREFWEELRIDFSFKILVGFGDIECIENRV